MPDSAQTRDHRRRESWIRIAIALGKYFTAVTAALGTIQLVNDLDLLTVVLAVAGAFAWVGTEEAHRTDKHRLSLLLFLTCFAAGVFAVVHVLAEEDDSAGRDLNRPMEIGEVPTEGHPGAIAAARDGNVWVVGNGGGDQTGTLSRIDSAHPNKDAKPIDSFKATFPYDIAIGKSAIWVTDGGALIKLDLGGRKIWRRRIVNGGENEVDVGLGLVWFKQTDPGRLIGLKPGSGERVVKVSLHTEATALAVGRGAVWVSTRYQEPVAVVKIARNGGVKKWVEVPDGPLDLAVGKDFVAMAHEGNFVTRIDPRSKGGELLPGDSELEDAELPSGVAIDNGVVWVAMTDSDKVFALRECDGKVLGWAETNDSPLDVAALDGTAFVPNSGSGDVSVFKLRRPVERCT